VRYLNDFAVRYTGDSSTVISAVREAIDEINPALPVSDVTTMAEAVQQSIANQRLVAQLSSFFALLAFFLSCIGVYRLMSYTVARRTSEIGLRMTLGARPPNVMWLVLRESLSLVFLGLAIGILAALAGGQVVAGMLYGVHGKDPVSLFAGAAILMVVAALAGYLPARRASLVDPMFSLRYE
jgi:ABC-type antimicrobial peptide transport system permease subunit